jgi:hypothetical protein
MSRAEAKIDAYKAKPTKQREGDQLLPEVNDQPFVQDKVIEDLSRGEYFISIEDTQSWNAEWVGDLKRMIADVEARKAIGIERYGTPLQAFNGRDVLQDLYEELIDAATYTKQALIEGHDLEAYYWQLLGQAVDVRTMIECRDE